MKGPKEIDQFLDLLATTGGSDLHIAVGSPPIMRVNGVLRRLQYPPITAAQAEQLVGDILGENHRRELDRDLDCDFAYEGAGDARFRVNAFRERNGLSAVFRVVPTEIPSAEQISMPPAVRRLAVQHKGLVLITGPTGSGKSTTLASLVGLINQHRHAHIITIEDPIEFVHTSKKSLVRQREIGPNARDFTRALRAALRQDPDVVLVGELRDIETIALAVTAAETGHLVLGTLHTMSAAKTIDRLIDAFPHEQQEQIRIQMAETLQAVISQQLLPRKDGQGRVAAYEVLLRSNAVSNLIREGKTHQIKSAMQTGRERGMQVMDASLADLVRKNWISDEDALEKADDRKALEKELGRMRTPA